MTSLDGLYKITLISPNCAAVCFCNYCPDWFCDQKGINITMFWLVYVTDTTGFEWFQRLNFEEYLYNILKTN